VLGFAADAECQCRGLRCRRSRGRNYANYLEALLHGLQKRYGGRHTATTRRSIANPRCREAGTRLALCNRWLNLYIARQPFCRTRRPMATTSISRPRTSWVRPKNLIFACIALMAAYVIRHNEHFIIDRSDPFWVHIQTFKWWLLPHGLAGACALVLAPLQFSDRLRQRHTKMHRIVGRIYITGVFILAPLGVYIEYLEERIGFSRSETIFTAVFAVLLMSATAFALFLILHRRIQQHRQWMTRSYAVALVFFEARLIPGIFGLDDNVAAGDTIDWICLVLAIPLADVVLQLQESWRTRTPASQ
jgi:uncharacterized membrane protein